MSYFGNSSILNMLTQLLSAGDGGSLQYPAFRLHHLYSDCPRLSVPKDRSFLLPKVYIREYCSGRVERQRQGVFIYSFCQWMVDQNFLERVSLLPLTLFIKRNKTHGLFLYAPQC